MGLRGKKWDLYAYFKRGLYLACANKIQETK